MMLLHAPQQTQCPVHVDPIVIQRDLATFAYSLQCREMYYIVDIWMSSEYLVKFLLIGDVAVVVFGTLAANELNAVENFFGGIVEVVGDDDFVVCFKKGERCERANIARATTSTLIKTIIEQI